VTYLLLRHECNT
jgi:hypothetical protein